jgi:uncharacterized protein
MEKISYTIKSILLMQSQRPAGKIATHKLMQKLIKTRPKKLDDLVHNLHYSEFDKINCHECANCCKCISPAIYESDIRRMAALLRIKASEFIDEFLLKDVDENYVFQKTPCPFLDDDNSCKIYNTRPRACHEYPHTDRKRFYQILELTAENAKICPAVFNIVENLKKEFTVEPSKI